MKASEAKQLALDAKNNVVFCGDTLQNCLNAIEKAAGEGNTFCDYYDYPSKIVGIIPELEELGYQTVYRGYENKVFISWDLQKII